MTIAQIKTYFQTSPEELKAFKAEIQNQRRRYMTGSQGIIDRCQCVVMAAEGNYSNIKEVARDLPHSEKFVAKWLARALVPVSTDDLAYIDSLEEEERKNTAWSKIVVAKMSDAPRSGRPSALSNSLLLLLDCLLLLTPDFVASAGIFPDLIEYLTGKQGWTLSMLSRVTGLSIGCVHKYIKMLGIDYDHSLANSDSYCWSSDPDYLRKVLLIDLLYRYAEAAGICLLCFDEMPCIQALYSEAVINQGGKSLDCSRYERNDYIHVLGLLRPATGKIYHQCVTSKNAEAVTEFLLQQLGNDDFKDKERIVIIWDNLNVHGDKMQTAIKQAFPNVEFAYTPTNASWINQVESAFSLISRFAVAPNKNKLRSTKELSEHIDRFVASHNQSAKPFHWDYQIKRDINQRANTLSNLAFVASEFKAIEMVPEALDGTNGIDAHYVSIIRGMAAHADVTPMLEDKNREYFNIDAISERVETVRQLRGKAKGTEILHASPKEMRASLLLDAVPIQVFTEKVEEAYSKPDKALELINELLVTLPHRPYCTPPSFKLDTQINLAKQRVDKAQEAFSQAQERQKQHLRNTGAVEEQSHAEIERLETKLKDSQKHYDGLLAKRSAITQQLLETHQRLLSRLADQVKRAAFLWKRFLAKLKKRSTSSAALSHSQCRRCDMRVSG